MTKQDAIDLLDNLIGFIDDNQNNDYDTAFKMAIEALKHKDKYWERRIDAIKKDCLDAPDLIPFVGKDVKEYVKREIQYVFDLHCGGVIRNDD